MHWLFVDGGGVLFGGGGEGDKKEPLSRAKVTVSPVMGTLANAC